MPGLWLLCSPNYRGPGKLCEGLKVIHPWNQLVIQSSLQQCRAADKGMTDFAWAALTQGDCIKVQERNSGNILQAVPAASHMAM